MHYFIWNGIDSRTMGLMVGQLPPLQRAEERVEQVTIPGKPGAVTFIEGDYIYEAVRKDCKVYAKNEEDYRKCFKWLQGTGKVIFSNEPDRVYTGRISSAVVFQRYDNSLRTATISFICEPYKGQWPPESGISIANGATKQIVNPGDIPSKPIIHMPAVDATAGTAVISIDGNIYNFFHDADGGADNNGFSLDSETGILNTPSGYNSTIFVPQVLGLPTLPVGASTIEVSGFTAGIVIEPRWRWI